jgi:hypothetical protein
MRHGMVASMMGLCLAGSTVGCASKSDGTPMALPDAAPDAAPIITLEIKDLSVTTDHNVDLLVVVDDSPSMADKQINLAANLPRFIDALGTLPGGLPDLHIGVVTSDLGTKGAEEATAGPAIGTLGTGGCSGLGKAGDLQLFGAPVTDAFLSDIGAPGGARQTNYTGDLSNVFGWMVRAGAGGCGFEQPLEAIKLALAPGKLANQGFLRPDATLAILIVTDEDDCSFAHSALVSTLETSALGPLQSFRCTRFGVVCDDQGETPAAMNEIGAKSRCRPAEDSPYLTRVADYASFLRSVKPDPNRIVVAGLMGTLDPFAVELRAPAGSTITLPALAHSCVYIGGDGKPELADPPVRIAAFLDQFPHHNAFAKICQQDLSGALAEVAATVKNAMLGDPCMHGALADVDGAQDACDVSVVTDRGAPSETAAPLPRCTPDDATATNAPCWRIAVAPESCPSGDNLELRVEGLALLPARGHVIAKCSVKLRA